MGLLDDAIREHLELKRRRGADVAEVTRQEKEAFGPIGTIAEEVPEPAPLPEEPTRLHIAEEPVDPAPPAPVADFHREPEPELEPPRPHGDPADRFPSVEAEPVEPPPAAAEPVAPPADPEPDPVPDPAAPSQPTREFDIDEVRAATGAEPEVVEPEEDPEAEDVLEETPEFLQETPEHDRLWFEQRPPRDFDF